MRPSLSILLSLPEVIQLYREDDENKPESSNKSRGKKISNNDENDDFNDKNLQDTANDIPNEAPIIYITDPDGVSETYNDPLYKGKQKMPSNRELNEAEEMVYKPSITLQKMDRNLERMHEINRDCKASSSNLSSKELVKKYGKDFWDVVNEIGDDNEKLEDQNIRGLTSKNDVIQETIYNPLKRKFEDSGKEFQKAQKSFRNQMPDLEEYELFCDSESDSEYESKSNSDTDNENRSK